MSDIVVTLLAVKPCELNKFLSKYYSKDMNVLDDAFSWSIFSNALNSTLILSTLIDNQEDYSIDAFISIKKFNNIKVTKENINDLIKTMYILSA